MEEAEKRISLITQAGREAGIEGMDYGATRSTNTLDAHRLSKYAKEKGVDDMEEIIYHAFFCEQRNIGQREVWRNSKRLCRKVCKW